MNTLIKYNKLIDIKSFKTTLYPPMYKPSKEKIFFTINEIDLYYDPITKSYKKEKKKGADDHTGGSTFLLFST